MKNCWLLGLVLIGFIALVDNAYASRWFESSNYSVYNTPYGTRVVATGDAADNAALANSSYNCPSCAVSGNNRGGGYIPYSQRPKARQNGSNKLVDGAMQTFSNELSYTINNSIRDAFK